MIRSIISFSMACRNSGTAASILHHCHISSPQRSCCRRSSFSGGYDLFSLRGGVALAAPLNEDRRTLLYANAMGFVGRRENKDRIAAPQYDDASFIGPDLAVGLSHRFAPNIALDIRYRAQFFFSIGGSGKFAEPKTTHGPSLGLSYGF